MPGRATSIADLGPSLHLVRHGEVANPGHVVYGDLPGFGLSEPGRAQASAAGRHLARRPVERVVCSPLQRAVSTGWAIGARHGLAPEVDERLTEWPINAAWVGHPWEDLPTRFPGQLEAYLADAASLEFAAETLAEMGTRVIGAIAELWEGRAGPWEDVVVVFHQDPMETARRLLTRHGLGGYGPGKPGHGEVVSLTRRRRLDGWVEALRWSPS
jgi:broad specificity phosphatase PhoE